MHGTGGSVGEATGPLIAAGLLAFMTYQGILQLSLIPALVTAFILLRFLRDEQAAADWMRSRHAEGVTLCSVCAGAFVLAATGLINGRRATTHWAFAEALAERFPQIKLAANHMVIDDGDIITAGGILAWTDLGLTLVAKFMGPGVMLSTARFLLIDPPRHEQRAFDVFVPKFEHGDAEILRVQHHLHAKSAEPQSIPDLAGRAGLTGRTFLRRFAKATGLRPTEYLQQVRIRKAPTRQSLPTSLSTSLHGRSAIQTPPLSEKCSKR
jgi:transcriptional regulator GlxA family with amidase domain